MLVIVPVIATGYNYQLAATGWVTFVLAVP